MFESLKEVPIWLIAFLISGAFHEFSHAWSAYKLGDPTAAMEGRLTINPLPHIDWTGVFFLVISAMAGFGFGWMKPVPVYTRNLENPQRDMMLIALAGPVSNILLAIPFGLILYFNPNPVAFAFENPVGKIVFTFFALNLVLAIFNMIPVYPLDGSKVVAGLLPWQSLRAWENTYNFGWIILLALMFTGGLRVIFGLVMNPIISFVLSGK